MMILLMGVMLSPQFGAAAAFINPLWRAARMGALQPQKTYKAKFIFARQSALG
jgi:hypothetical protein